MLSSSLQQLKKTLSPSQTLAVVRDLSRRTMHGATGWVRAEKVEHYQPQDQDDQITSIGDVQAVDFGRTRRKMLAGEPEDARLTGGTRSLMRRLTGLNLGRLSVSRSTPVLSKGLAIKTSHAA